jgi:hypothetical protein
MESFSTRDQIAELINKLFVYTDLQEWSKLQSDVFTPGVLFDMTSLGGERMTTTSKNICEIWEKGFQGIDSVNHLAGNYLIQINGEVAEAFAYATATHYKKSATQGNTREFIGTYNLHFRRTDSGWRIDQFKYNLKYATGNQDFK